MCVGPLSYLVTNKVFCICFKKKFFLSLFIFLGQRGILLAFSEFYTSIIIKKDTRIFFERGEGHDTEVNYR